MGAAVLMAFVAFGVFLLSRPLIYRDGGYEKNYTWQGIEVGIVYRQPVNTPIMRGRHRCVIAFPEGKRAQARLLYTTVAGETSPPLEFVAANGAKGTYRVRDGEIAVDASTWAGKPVMTETGP